MNNHMEMLTFLQENSSHTQRKNSASRYEYRFPATIQYAWRNKKRVFRADVFAETEGYNDGSIHLTPNTEDISEETFHLDFSPDYQTYSFCNEINSLEITGSSIKMGGDYSVEIQI